MKATPFNIESDLAPIPFSEEVCRAAKSLKEKGLEWNPHVGCFVWDENNSIEVASPFPNQIYFILNLGHFLKIFNTLENMQEKLVWMPTWTQARQICKNLNISAPTISSAIHINDSYATDSELIALYNLIIENL